MTAETAMALPALVMVALVLVWLIGVAGAQLRCADAAREGARAMGRGDTVEISRALAAAAAPSGAEITVSPSADTVRVRVAVTVGAGGFLGGVLPDFTVHGSAVALREVP